MRNLAARQAMIVKGGWNNPYKMCNPIVILDGIQNTGRGDRKWIDLANGLEFAEQYGTDTSSTTFNNDSLSFNTSSTKNSYGCTLTNGVEISAYTIEMVVSPADSILSSTSNIGLFQSHHESTATDANAYIGPKLRYAANYFYTYPIGGWQVNSGIKIKDTKHFAVSYADGLLKFYKDGTLYGSDSNLNKSTTVVRYLSVGRMYPTHRDFPGGFVGKIYAIRLNGSVLTDKQIATNYAIDQARFNLT